MTTIRLHRVTPRFFSEQADATSEVWAQDMCFEKSKSYLLCADSGKGKSTLCSYLLGYRNDFTGQLFFDDTDASSLTVAQWVEIRKRHVSLLFQELRLFAELTAYENVEIKNSLTRHLSQSTIIEWFDWLGIADKRDAKVGQMSFGQQQRVALMRALAQPFDFLVVDEPISHLDDTNSSTVLSLIAEQVNRQQAGLIVTSIGKHFNMNYDRIVRL